jgi:hypothetical protein
MPRVEEDGSNLWTLGNSMIAAAREVTQNHV